MFKASVGSRSSRRVLTDSAVVTRNEIGTAVLAKMGVTQEQACAEANSNVRERLIHVITTRAANEAGLGSADELSEAIQTIIGNVITHELNPDDKRAQYVQTDAKKTKGAEVRTQRRMAPFRRTTSSSRRRLRRSGQNGIRLARGFAFRSKAGEHEPDSHSSDRPTHQCGRSAGSAGRDPSAARKRSLRGPDRRTNDAMAAVYGSSQRGRGGDTAAS
jgi:hypothetical protein